jgi:hypothetical protein
MKNLQIATLLLILLLAWPSLAKEKVDWQTIENLPPGTHVYVLINWATECSIQKVTEDRLYCTQEYPGSRYKGPHERADQVFNRSDIHSFCNSESETCKAESNYLCVGDMSGCYTYDASEGDPALIAAAGAGGGWRPGYEPNSFAGIKLGISGVTMDLQYDRLNAQSGFSVEGSGLIPVLRVPRWNPKNDRLHFRVYAEPGLGYRAGDGPFGQYASGKALVLLGSKWVDNGGPSPYIEFQRRFPFNSLLDGDNRIAFGFMFAICGSCGFD